MITMGRLAGAALGCVMVCMVETGCLSRPRVPVTVDYEMALRVRGEVSFEQRMALAGRWLGWAQWDEPLAWMRLSDTESEELRRACDRLCSAGVDDSALASWPGQHLVVICRPDSRTTLLLAGRVASSFPDACTIEQDLLRPFPVVRASAG